MSKKKASSSDDEMIKKGTESVEKDSEFEESESSNTDRNEFFGQYEPLKDDIVIEQLIKDKLEGLDDVEKIDNIKILAEIYEPEKKKWISLGAVIENLSLNDLDSEKTKIIDQIGEQYGPGWYKCKVHAAGKIRTAFVIELSDRKFKDPRNKKEDIKNDNNVVITMLMNQQAQLEARLAAEQQRSHEITLKMFENKKPEMTILEMFKMTQEMNKKNDNGSDVIMKEVFGLLKAGMELNQDAKEAENSQDILERIGGKIVDKVPSIFQALAGNKKLLDNNDNNVITAQIEDKNNHVSDEKIIDPKKIDPKIIQSIAESGAIIGLVDTIMLGFQNGDDLEIFSDQINILALYSNLSNMIISNESDDIILNNLIAIHPNLKSYLEDSGFKKYICDIFSDVRKIKKDEKIKDPEIIKGDENK